MTVAPSQDYLADLNPAQLEAVLAVDGPVLVVAGAGSGKTRVLTHRIVHLIRGAGAKPNEIIAITFTNKAAAEMKRRVEGLVGGIARTMWVMTFHSACGRILRSEAPRLGYKGNFTIYDQADQVRVVKACLEELDKDPKRFSPRGIHAEISRSKNQLVSPAMYSERVGSFYDQTVAEVYEAYQRRLFASNALDFDDMLMLTVDVLERFPEARNRWQKTFRWILVDEYQDTNHAQYRLLQLLAGKYKNVFAVGDPDQSIYAFRGADIRNVLEFEQDFPGAKTIALEQNYRSTNRILQAANAVIAHNRERKPKNLWSEVGEGEPVRVLEVEDEHAEARFVASEISGLVDGDHSASDIAVFYRTNAQSRVIEEILGTVRIPFQVIGGPRFYERAEVRDAIAYLQAIDNPSDTVSLAPHGQPSAPRRGGHEPRAAPGVRRRAGDHALGRDRPRRRGGRRAGAASGRGQAARAPRLARLGRAGALGSGSPRARLRAVGLHGGAPGRADDRGAGPHGEPDGAPRRRARSTTRRPTSRRLSEFLQQVSLYSDQDSIDEEGGKVTLMTLHNAKGLEFRAVFMIGMEEGVFPHARSLEEGSLEEERRLCYVGLTRARERLTLTHASARALYGSRNYNLPSRFIDELPQDEIERDRLRPTSWSGYGAPTVTPKREVEFPDLSTGDTVRHATMGEGVVTRIESDGTVTVRFADDGSERRLMLEYAPLERL